MKKISVILLSVFLCLALLVPCFADDDIDYSTETAYDYEFHICDIVDWLSESEYAELEERAIELSDKTDTYIIVWIEDIGTDDEQEVHDYCVDIADMFSTSDKTLICTLDPDARYVNIYASDETSFDTSATDYIHTQIADAMYENDNWYGGAVAFLNAVDDICVNDYTAPKETFEWGTHIAIAVGIGLVVALVVVLILKGQLKSVRHKTRANEYVKEGSFNVTNKRDIFLYNTVTRVKKPDDNSDSSHASGGGGHSSGGHV